MTTETMETMAAKEWPAIFSAWSVQRILARQKTCTRRIVSWTNSTVLGYPAKPYWPNLLFDHARPMAKASIAVALAGNAAPDDPHLSVPFRHPEESALSVEDLGRYRVRPKWEVGDRIWVRESCRYEEHAGRYGIRIRNGNLFTPAPSGYAAHVAGKIWRPNGWGRWHVRTPRWASRLTLEIAGVRVERVQDISAEDCEAEGVVCSSEELGGFDDGLAFFNYIGLWESIHGKGAWARNDWVWVVSFKVIEPAPGGDGRRA